MDVSGHLHAPAALTLGKETPYPLDRTLDGPQSLSGLGGEAEIPCPFRESTTVRPTHSLVTILTELPRLLPF
jgi:hypothetical protein